MIKEVFKKLLAVQIISVIAATAGMLVDGIVIGNVLGVSSMAAYGYVAPILTIFAAIGGTIASGAQTSCSGAMGRGDIKTANSYFVTSLVAGLILSIIGLVVIFAFTDPVCVLLGANAGQEMMTLAGDYMRGYVIGAPGFIGMQILMPFMQLDGDRTRAMVSMIAMTAGDIVLDILNAFVFHGGMFGMGMASSVSYYIALIILLLHFAKKNCSFAIRVRDMDIKKCACIFGRGATYSVHQICRTLLVVTLNRILFLNGGDGAVAAYSVINTVGNICNACGSGIGNSTLMVSSVMAGEENKKSLREVIQAFVKNSVLINGIVMILVIVFAPVLIRLFLGGNQTVAGMAAAGLRFYALCLIFYSINTGFRNYLQGVGRLLLSHIMCVAENYVWIVLSALLLSGFLGTNGVWLSFFVGEALTFVTLLCLGLLAQHRFTVRLNELLFLPNGFGVPENEMLEYEIHDMDEIMNASRNAMEFCLNKGADERLAMAVSLSVEEMGGNVVRHGFTDSLNNKFELRILHKESGWVIRMRDNCHQFDPVQYISPYMKQSRDGEHIGIRLVSGIAKKVQYINALEFNNLIITL